MIKYGNIDVFFIELENVVFQSFYVSIPKTGQIFMISIIDEHIFYSLQGLAKYGADLSDDENDVAGDVYSSAKDKIKKQDLSKDSIAYDSELDKSSSEEDQG